MKKLMTTAVAFLFVTGMAGYAVAGGHGAGGEAQMGSGSSSEAGAMVQEHKEMKTGMQERLETKEEIQTERSDEGVQTEAEEEVRTSH